MEPGGRKRESESQEVGFSPGIRAFRAVPPRLPSKLQSRFLFHLCAGEDYYGFGHLAGRNLQPQSRGYVVSAYWAGSLNKPHLRLASFGRVAAESLVALAENWEV
jgi:hypothetical protein